MTGPVDLGSGRELSEQSLSNTCYNKRRMLTHTFGGKERC